MHYRICVRGPLDPTFEDRFGGLHIQQQETGTTSGRCDRKAIFSASSFPRRARGRPLILPSSQDGTITAGEAGEVFKGTSFH